MSELRPRDREILVVLSEAFRKLIYAEIYERLRKEGWAGNSSAGITATLDRLQRMRFVECEPWGTIRLWWITPAGQAAAYDR